MGRPRSLARSSSSTRPTGWSPTTDGGSGATWRRTSAPARSSGRRIAPSTSLLTSAAPTARHRRPAEVAGGRGRGQGRRARHRSRRPRSRSVHRLAREAGIDPRGPSTPFLDARARTAAIDGATAAVLRAVDLPGLERQAEAATRARARARGTGPMGRVTSLLYRASGRETQRRRSRRLPRSLAGPWPADARGRGDPGRPVGAAACGQPGGPTRSSPRPWNRPSCAAASSGRSTGRSAVSVRSSHRPAAGGRSSASSRCSRRPASRWRWHGS